MSNAEFIASARKFAAQFKGFLSIADELEKVESIEQMSREAQLRLAALQEQEKQTQQVISRRHAQAEMEIAQKHRDANHEIEEKRRSASDMIDDAHDQASRIVSAAKAEAAGFEQRADEHKREAAGLRLEIEALKALIDEHNHVAGEAGAAAVIAKRQHENEVAALRAFRASLPQ
jgi:chromosome segregation ATPase